MEGMRRGEHDATRPRESSALTLVRWLVPCETIFLLWSSFHRGQSVPTHRDHDR
jgi:hypothetical protein